MNTQSIGRSGVLRFAWLPLPERTFVLVAITCIIATRLAVILMTPRTADFLDPRIYQATGQVVLAGVNPYDYSDDPPLRERLRAGMAAPGTEGFTRTQRLWNYYISGNPPGSTALYALFEALAHGSRLVWRLLLISGDVTLFLGVFALLKTLRGRVEGPLDQAGMFCLAVINPILIVSGCAIPEDKQFQTGLMLFSAAMVLSPAAATARRAFGTGLVLSLSIFFKVLGVFLAPLWLARFRREGWRYALRGIVGAAIPAALSFAAFGPRFIDTLAARGVRDSFLGAEHASPWVLFPLVGHTYIIAKIVAVGLFCAALLGLLVKRRIDLLNLCAGTTVAFVCLWLDKGAMNRMNIAIVFAIASLSSLSTKLFAYLAISFAALSAASYALGLGVFKDHLDRIDALLALAFLLTYLATLLAFTNPALSPELGLKAPLRA